MFGLGGGLSLKRVEEWGLMDLANKKTAATIAAREKLSNQDLRTFDEQMRRLDPYLLVPTSSLLAYQRLSPQEKARRKKEVKAKRSGGSLWAASP